MRFEGIFSGAPQGDLGDLWRAVETEGNADSAESAIDVELQVLQAEEALDIFLAQRGKGHGGQEGEANLPAMRVAAEHELDRWSGRVLEKLVDEVRLVTQQEDRFFDAIPHELRNGEVYVGMAFNGVVKT
jgi:hypothetical protein